jgi:hypothetical protein
MVLTKENKVGGIIVPVIKASCIDSYSSQNRVALVER